MSTDVEDSLILTPLPGDVLRAAIVAWLRSDDVVDVDPEMTLILAGCIERGEHLRDDDE